MPAISVVYFDLGATLVDPIVRPDGTFVGFTVLPGVIDGLTKLGTHGPRLGVISNTGAIDTVDVREALDKVELSSFFDDELVLLSGEVGLDKSTPAIFRLALKRARLSRKASSGVFVGEDAAERRTARQAGMQTNTSLVRIVKLLSGRQRPHLG
jgi:FMN phosphatase YigB (HAD superfamily)